MEYNVETNKFELSDIVEVEAVERYHASMSVYYDNLARKTLDKMGYERAEPEDVKRLSDAIESSVKELESGGMYPEEEVDTEDPFMRGTNVLGSLASWKNIMEIYVHGR